MEASRLTVRGEDAGRVGIEFLDTKAREAERSLNKRGVRNIHRYGGDGFTQVAYEQGSVYDESWVMVSVLVERVDDRTSTVVVFVGGGGRGPFKLEEVSLRRIRRGEGSVGEAGRFGTVLADLRDVVESLDLEVVTEWESETEPSIGAKIAREVFEP